MKTTILLSLISTAVVALSQPAWAGGGGGFHGGGFGGGFRGGGFGAGGFRGGAVAAQPLAGGVGSRGGGVGFGSPRFSGGGFRAAPYRYNSTHFATRSPGGTTGAFRYYNGGSRTPAARTYQFSGRENQSTGSYAGRNTTVARQQNRPALLTRQNMRTSNTQSSAVRRAMANHRVFARHDGNWHHDWDKHHAHFDHGHVFVFTDGFWWGLYPWDYYPYDAYGSYPSDSYGDPYGYNDYPYNSSDSYTQEPYSYYTGYASPAQGDNAVVSSIQSQLAKFGYYGGAVDGVLGDQTEAAIAHYQEDNDLSVTGTVTAATLQSLGLAGR
ncbi:MAG TPA: peptidoglycan-binding domain-containing protein [Candidatus Udaeobacter sp.]